MKLSEIINWIKGILFSASSKGTPTSDNYTELDGRICELDGRIRDAKREKENIRQTPIDWYKLSVSDKEERKPIKLFQAYKFGEVLSLGELKQRRLRAEEVMSSLNKIEKLLQERKADEAGKILKEVAVWIERSANKAIKAKYCELEGRRKRLIAELKEEEELKKRIDRGIEKIGTALQNAQIEVAKAEKEKLEEIATSLGVDEELRERIREVGNNIEERYTDGITDNYDIFCVDYPIPDDVQDRNCWNYPVVKYPEYGNIVFTYRRRRKINRRGYMEAGFQVHLQNVFNSYGLLIIGDCSVLPADDHFPYEPDIAIICENHPSIRIDVEIDEPYSGFDHRPIHYIGCGDDFRDIKFNNFGWIVIRFTEYQVFSDKDGCVAFIAQVIKTIDPDISLPPKMLSYTMPNEVQRWSEIEAKLMATERYREKYLNHEFGRIESEPITIADITQTEKEKKCAELLLPILPIDTGDVNPPIPTTETRDRDIQFFPYEHIYLYRGRTRFVPVSNVVSYFFKPFDSERWSSYKAQQQGVPQGQILEEWDVKGCKSRELGTFMHKQIENAYNGVSYKRRYPFHYHGKYICTDEEIMLDKEYEQFRKFRNDHVFQPFRTEWAIYDENLEIAGTIDMIHKRGEVFDIYDWKRSHRIVAFGKPIKVNSYGTKGIRGLENIHDTAYWHYCIQQNIYQYILEHNYDIIVDKMFLVVFIDEEDQYRKIEVPRMDDIIGVIVGECKSDKVKSNFYERGYQHI